MGRVLSCRDNSAFWRDWAMAMRRVAFGTSAAFDHIARKREEPCRNDTKFTNSTNGYLYSSSGSMFRTLASSLALPSLVLIDHIFMTDPVLASSVASSDYVICVDSGRPSSVHEDLSKIGFRSRNPLCIPCL